MAAVVILIIGTIIHQPERESHRQIRFPDGRVEETGSCLELALKKELTPEVAAMAKLQTTELLTRLLDQCLQFHGGTGYMWEYPICRAYADSCYMRIAGGSNEIMRDLIARTF